MSRSPTTLDAILDGARRAFLADGFDGASMDAIAREAGVARRTLYNRFASKEVLFQAVAQRLWTRLSFAEIVTAEAARDPAVGVRGIALALGRFWASPDAIALLRLAVLEQRRFPTLVRDFLLASDEPGFQLVVAYLTGHAVAGRLAITEPDLAVRQLFGLINEPLVWPAVLGLAPVPDAERALAVAQAAADLFLAATAPCSS